MYEIDRDGKFGLGVVLMSWDIRISLVIVTSVDYDEDYPYCMFVYICVRWYKM